MITSFPEIDPIAELTAAVNLGKKLASQSRDGLEAATPILIEAICYHSGQSAKLERILWSLWNDDLAVNLCNALAGLDTKLAQAAVAMIAARAHMGGEADDFLRKIIDDSGSQPPPA
jgi:hypothetical protein